MRAERQNRTLDNNASESQRRIRRAMILNERRYSLTELQDLAERTLSTSSRSLPRYQGWAPSRDDISRESEWNEPLPVPTSGLASTPRSSADFYDEQRRALLASGRSSQNTAREAQSAIGNGAGQILSTSESSLRTAALLQSVRRNSQFSARARSQLQNSILERERAGRGSESRDQLSNLDPRNRGGNTARSVARPGARSPTSEQLRQLARREMIMSGYLGEQDEDAQPRDQPSSKWYLDDAISYLERLRFCESYEESISSAAAGGFVREEFFSTNHDDFILDTAMIDPPADSSWLKIGAIFAGSQHATGPPFLVRNRSEDRAHRSSTALQPIQAQGPPTNRHSYSYTLSHTTPAQRSHARQRTPSTNSENVDPSRQYRTMPLNSAAERSLLQHATGDPSDERWPVKVRIHNIDYQNMTLAGTMEAFNVPDKTSPTSESSITTYLEGEIIDFNKFTLETKNFKTDEDTDSKHWRMLEPFKNLTDDEIVRGLVSKKWMRDELREKWILMRWKGMHSEVDS